MHRAKDDHGAAVCLACRTMGSLSHADAPSNGENFDRKYRTQVKASGGETVASYLNRRLKQIGVSHVFCIPGDYLAEWAATLDDPETNAGFEASKLPLFK